jgi:hypothetical protein
MAIQEWAAKSIKAAMNKGQQALSGGKNLIGNAVGDTLDVGKQLYNQVSFQPEVQPTQDQITADFLRRLQDEGGAALQMARDVGGDALQRGGQIGGQALGLGGQALGGLLDIAKKPETWRTAADLMAIASAPYSPQLAETYSGISGRIGDRMEARDLVEREAAEAQAAAIKDQEKADAKITAAKLKADALVDAEDLKHKRSLEKLPTGYFPLEDENLIADVATDPLFNQLMITQPHGEGKAINLEGLQNYKKEKEVETAKLDNDIAEVKSTNELIDRILFDPNLEKVIGKKKIAGGWINLSKEWLAGLGGTDEQVQSLINAIDTKEAGKVLQTMKDLKAQSSSGSTGFGALNIQELNLLTNAFISLRKGGSAESFRKNLEKLQKSVNDRTISKQSRYTKKYTDTNRELHEHPFEVRKRNKESQETALSQVIPMLQDQRSPIFNSTSATQQTQPAYKGYTLVSE